MTRKLLILFSLIALICSMAAVSAADDASQTFSDTSILASTDGGTFTELQEKVNNAEEGSTINLENDYAYDDAFSNNGIFINKSLTIDGKGHTLDGKNSARIFSIADEDLVGSEINLNVTLKNINFINANASSGGAIDIWGVNITILNCTFKDNTAGIGGAIWMGCSRALIDNSQFIGNALSESISGCGAAICFAYNFDGTVVSNSVFNNNQAREYLASGLWPDFEYENGVVYLLSSDGLLDHQIDFYVDWGIYPTITFTNVSYNEFKNQSFVSDEKKLSYGLDNRTIRFEVYDGDNLLINTTNVTENGKAQIDYKNASLGDLVLIEAYYKNLTYVQSFEYKRDSNFTMSVENIRLGEDLLINFDISPEIENYDEAKGYCKIWNIYGDFPVYSSYFNFKDKNITIKYPNYSSPGNYTVTLYFEGDENFSSKYITRAFEIYPVDYNTTGNKTVITADYFYKTFGDNKRLYVNLTDADLNPLKNKEISIEINGMTYTRTTDDNGRASIAINLDVGYYTYIVSFGGDSDYAPSIDFSYISIDSSISMAYMEKFCKGPEPFEAQFFNSYGSTLSGGTATFNINGVFYERKINSEGYAKLNINLDHGEYIITATNPVTGEMSSSTICILPTITENHDLVKYYRNDSQYVVKLDGDLTDKKVTFNINGVFYERYANETGHVKLNINLQPGEYIITAEHNGCRVANNIKVLPVLNATDLKMTYRDGSKFNVTLLNGEGKVYPGQNVTFNVNGVFYNRTTDVNGVAHLNINLMAGEYIITSSYNGSNIANKITISS
ncbi:hypothetical protein [Methanobrevibacter sp.]|uniref:hypothetical protein n=1 Tax=Methanobrevibacter sp. TaxID=66852 RepID=UPI0038901853